MDHFAAFVDRVSIDLDAVPHTATELAGQAYLSRYHFERVIAATAGETPTRFRSRVLLERAAYRLITTDRPLLDLALEAGFTSNAAFSRAFRREYDAAPSRWRRRPGRFQIPSPNEVHFHPPSGLRLPARDTMGGMELVAEMVAHHVWLVGQFIERAARLSDAELDAPVTGQLAEFDGTSLRWALSRLVGQLDMWNHAVADEPYDFAVEDHESVLSMRARFTEVGPTFIANVRRYAAEDRFDETFVEAIGRRPVVLSYGAMVAHVLTFAAHHRLLAIARLRECGVTDLGIGDPKDWFARRIG